MFFFGGCVSQHMNAGDEAYMLRRPSSLYWFDSITTLSCLEISSVTLTPMSSPESNLSGGLLTPPPAKPLLLPPKLSEGCIIPRPRVKLLFYLSPTASCHSQIVLPLLPLHLLFFFFHVRATLVSFFKQIVSLTPHIGWQHLHETTVHRHF